MLLSLRNDETKSIRLENLHEHFKGWSIAEMLAIETAYSEVAWFRAAIDHRTNAFSNVPFDVMQIKGDVVATEADYEEELEPKLNIFRVLAELITDLDLYGEAYADFETNGFGLNGAWRRLHPTSIRKVHNTVTGELLYFERIIGGTITKIELDDPDFFWLWMPARRTENYPGEGVGKTALRGATTINNTDIFQATFFKNGALNPTIVQIKGFATADKAEKESIQGLFTRMMTGVANAFKIVPVDAEVKLQSLMQNLKDMAMTELTQQQRENISTATGVPHSLLFSNASNFATAQQDDFNFYDKTIVPFAVRIIEQQLNERFFKPLGYRLKYRKERMEVYQRIEIDKADKLMALFNAGIMDENEVRQQVGLSERPDDFEVPSRLVANTQNPEADTPEQEADTQADTASTQRLQDGEDEEEKKSLAGKALDAYAYLPLANNADLIRIVQRLKNRLNDERIQWQAAPTYHVTLCYAHLIANDVIDQMARILRPIEAELIGAYLDVFETPDGKALHLRLESTPSLSTLQSHVYDVFSMLPNGGISEYSRPEGWKPHITLAYLPNDIEWESEPMNWRDMASCVIVGRDDYEPALIVEAPKRIVLDVYAEMKTDLQKWERLAIKRLEESKPEKARDFDSQHITGIQKASIIGALESAQSTEDVKAIFEEAQQVAPLWGMYA